MHLSSRQSVGQTWRRFTAQRGHADRDRLFGYYRHLVDRQVRRFARRLPGRIAVDELRSAAFEGLLHAVESFDPSRNAQFEHFCQQRIRGAMLDWLRAEDTQTRRLREFERQQARMRSLLQTELGRPPSADEMADHLQLAPPRYRQLCKRLRAGRMIPLSTFDRARSAGGMDGRSPMDTPARTADTNPSTPLARELVRRLITRGLGRTERTILVLYYYEDLTMAEIGMVLGFSESRVCQLHKAILTHLKDRFGAQLADVLRL